MTDRRQQPQFMVDGGAPCTPRQAAAIAAVARLFDDAGRTVVAPAPAPLSGWEIAAREEAVERL